MKSKMKSAFALIAVALMIMVAVVPMALVFTGDSDAADTNVVDPAIASNIHIEGVVYNAAGGNVGAQSDNYVKVAFNSYTLKATVGTNGAYEIYIEESSVNSVTLTYVDKDGVQVANYSPVVLNNVTASATSYKADLKAGMTTATVTLKFKGGSSAVITDSLPEGSVVSGTYKVFVGTTAADAVEKSSGSITKGTFVISYPVLTTGQYVFVQITGFSVTGIENKAITVDETAKVQLTISGTEGSYVADYLVKEYLYTVSFAAAITSKVPLTIKTLTSTDGATPPVETSMKYIKNTVYNGSSALFTSTVTAGTLKATVAYGSETAQELTGAALSVNSYAITATPVILYGAVTMSTYAQVGTLNLTTGAGATLQSYSVSTDAKGNYAMLSAATSTVYTVVSFVSNNVSFAKASGQGTITSGTDIQTVSLDATAYSEVKGHMYMKSTTVAIQEKNLSVTVPSGSTLVTFGPLTTGEDGSIGFMATTGANLTIKGNDNVQYTGNINVVAGTQTSDIVIYMATQKVSIKIEDARGKIIGTTYTIKAELKDGNTTTAKTIWTTNHATNDFFVQEEVNGEKTTTYYAYIRADLTPTQYYVWATGYKGTTTTVTHTFAKALYAEGGEFKSAEALYKFSLYTATGTLITKQGATDFVVGDVPVYISNVYKNSEGAIVYTPVTSVTLTMTTVGSGIFETVDPVDATYFSFDESKVTTTPIKAAVVYPGPNADKAAIFKDAYFLSSDSVGACKVTASQDSFTGKVVRLDGKTPIVGAVVQIGTQAAAGSDLVPQSDKGYTDSTGSFTVYSDTLFKYGTGETEAAASRILITADGYDFKTKTVVLDKVFESATEKKEKFKPVNDAYEFTFVDADGMPVILSTGNYITVGTKNITVAETDNGKSSIITKANWTSKTEPVSVSLKVSNDGAVLRTFEKHAFTADELSSGEITFVTQQSTYYVSVEDADGYAQDMASTAGIYYALFDGVTFGAIPDGIPAMTLQHMKTDKGADITGEYYGIITDLDNATLAAAKVTGFAIKPTVTGLGLDGTEYFMVEAGENTIETAYATITFYIRDAAGKAISGDGPIEGTVYKDGVALTSGVTIADKKVVIKNDPEATYAVTLKDCTYTGDDDVESTYTFESAQEPTLGVLFANEEWVYGDIQDAAGTSIGDAGTVVTSYIGLIPGNTAKYVATDDEAYYKILVDTEDVTGYYVEDFGNYTFEISSSPIIRANEMKVEFSAVSANGVEFVKGDEGVTIANAAAYDENGMKISKGAFADYVIVDVDDVAYYSATVTYVDNKYTFDKESLLPVFIANESLISGTVPYTGGAAAGSVRLDLYLGENLVKSVAGKISADKYNYTAILDLSDYVVEGVAFDSIIAVYSEGGIVIGAAAVDPFTQVNDIVSPVAQQFEVELVAPSAIVALHVDYAQVGNTVTVTADGKFIVADDESIYTDGQYIYTFAGWYVDNEKVSANPVFTFTMTENVIISPQYTVTYEKTSDVNKDVEKEYVNIVEKVEVPVEKTVGIDTNVLIIGICAVIVALIAVVYAVIKKD